MFEAPGAIISIIIFMITFGIMITEKIDRTIISLFGATVMIGVGQMLNFYTYDQVSNAIDFNTILLLFGMMVIVAEFEKSGFFQYLAVKVAKKTGGNLRKLVLFLGALTSVLSMILDNVTTIVMIVPITLVITKLLKLNPIPILIAEGILANIGGTATLIGDPPNILIGSAAQISFNDFFIHAFPIVIITWLSVLMFIKFTFRSDFLTIPKNLKSLMKINEGMMIKNPIILKKALIVLGMVIVGFLIHDFLGIPPSYVAILGAAFLVMIISPHKDPKSIFKKVELSVLVFFISLFVLVGGLEATGVLDGLANMILSGAKDNILLTAIIVLWVSAILSSIIDNIPMTIAMIPIIAVLEVNGIYGVNLLWWALIFGVGFGGNFTPIGSTAGVIIMTKLNSNKTPITLAGWMKVGVPTTLIALTITTYIFIVFYKFFM